MLKNFKQFVNSINKTKVYLILANIVLVFFLILLGNLKIIPFRAMGDFVFFVCLVLAFALYRPGWAFLFFIGTIALENINLAPKEIGIAVRPYQLIGALTILAVSARFFTKRLNFKLPKFGYYDLLFLIFAIAGFVSAFGAIDKLTSFKQSVIITSFVALYFLTKVFVQNSDDVKKIIPFFLSSSVVVMLYGIWQNIRFAHNLNSFEIMPGRPNGTFTEPDWLGMYLVFLLAGCYALVYFFTSCHSCENGNPVCKPKDAIPDPRSPIKAEDRFREDDKKRVLPILLYIYLILIFTLLIISVVRSAWLAAIAATILFLFIIFTNLKFNFREWQWKKTIKLKIYAISAFIISLAAVYFFHLTTFQLFNRAQSVGTGEQEITISCDLMDGRDAINRVSTGGAIYDISELEQFGCRHINLEEIESEKARGNFVTEVYRKDPNVSARAEIYEKSWTEIKVHPILGIGWGNIGAVLGRDDRGTSLNSSNIFLETWLGSGIVGFFCLIIILGNIFIQAIVNFYKTENVEQKALALFVILSWTGIVVFNLFNAGIMLGLFWVWIGIAGALNYENRN